MMPSSRRAAARGLASHVLSVFATTTPLRKLSLTSVIACAGLRFGLADGAVGIGTALGAEVVVGNGF